MIPATAVATVDACSSFVRTSVSWRRKSSRRDATGPMSASDGPVSIVANCGVGLLAQLGQALQGGDPVGAQVVGGFEDGPGPADGPGPDVRHPGGGAGEVLDRTELTPDDGEDVDGGQKGRVEEALGPGELRPGCGQLGPGPTRDEIGGRQVRLGRGDLGHGVAGVAKTQGQDHPDGEGPEDDHDGGAPVDEPAPARPGGRRAGRGRRVPPGFGSWCAGDAGGGRGPDISQLSADPAPDHRSRANRWTRSASSVAVAR